MRTRFSRGLSAALAVSALSLTAACGGGASDDTKKDAADKPAAPQTTSAAPATPLTAAQMKAAALELKDLPPGWKLSTTTPDKLKPKADKPECQPIAGMLAEGVSGATIGANNDFERGNAVNVLSQQVMTFPGTGAADYVKTIGTALDACTSFVAEADGVKLKISVQKLTAPQVGEAAHAFRMKLDMSEVGMQIESNMLVVAQGTGATRLAHVPGDAAEHKNFDSLAKLAGEKFAKGAQG